MNVSALACPRRLTRRASLGLPLTFLLPRSSLVVDNADRAGKAEARLADLEATAGGRLGVAVFDTGDGTRYGRRVNERFPFCSTFKFLAAAFVLARVDDGEESLARRMTFTEADLVPHSPTTEQHIGGEGMSLEQLCEAATTLSDGTAANLLLESFGGPAALTAYARELGDAFTRLDRIEPDLNEALPGDPRDTTTPAAMLANLERIVLGDALSPASREQMITWMLANETGDNRLRAGFPTDWTIGDRTGSGEFGATNDIAVAWPPEREPIVVAAYFAESTIAFEARERVLADVARIVAGQE